MNKIIEELSAEHRRLSHAMQAGVAMDQARGSEDGSPKHLRTGVNVALRDHSSLVKLLIDKGFISEEEYMKYLVEGMKEEVAWYEDKLNLPPNIHLGGWSG